MSKDANSRTFEAAYYTLLQLESAQSRTVDSVDKFLGLYSEQLAKCYDPIPSSSGSSRKKLDDPSTKTSYGVEIGTVDDKVKQSAVEFAKAINIDEVAALEVVQWFDFKGVTKGEKRMLHYLRHYLAERRYRIKLVTLLFTLRASQQSVTSEDDEGSVYAVCRKHSTDIIAHPKFFEGLITFISNGFSTIPTIDDEAYAELYYRECALLHLDALNLLLTSLGTVIPTSSNLLFDWLDVIRSTDFFAAKDTSYAFDVEWYRQAHALCTLISISFLDMDQDFSLEGALEASYITQPDSLVKVQRALSELTHYKPAAPVLLCWGCVLHRISIRLDERPDPTFNPLYKECGIDLNKHDAVKSEELGAYAGKLITDAMGLYALHTVQEIFRRLPARLEFAQVGCSFLLACLPYINMNEDLAGLVATVISPFQELKDIFFGDEFADRALLLCRAKIPIALKPFLKLSQNLGGDAYEFVFSLSTYLQEMPRTFRDYEFDPKKPNIVSLTSELALFDPREYDGQGALVLHPGARGEIIPESTSTVVMWSLDYNGWTFLGRLLESELLSSKLNFAPDIMRLINNTLSELNMTQSSDMLVACSNGLGQGDFVELVTQMLDESLYNRNLEMCIYCVEFLAILTEYNPERVWPYVGRSNLLDKNVKGGLITAILGAVEIADGKYDFTIAVIKLVEALVKDSLSRALDDSISQGTRTEVVGNFTRYLIDVFESFAYWPYAKPTQKLEIASSIISVFTSIVYSTACLSGVQESDKDSLTPEDHKVTKVMAKASKVITEQFLSPNEACLRTLQPLLGCIESAAKSTYSVDGTPEGYFADSEMMFIRQVLDFCALLVRTRSYLELPLSLLERRLFTHSPDLVVIFVRYYSLHSAVTNTLEAIVSGYSVEDQPSLLAHLGTEYSQMLVTGYSKALRNDLEPDVTIGSICTFFSEIIRSKQEGLSILLLSGKDTRHISNKVESAESLLTVMEGIVSEKSRSLSPKLINDLLGAISLAHSNWNMSMTPSGDRQAQEKFAESLIDIVKRAMEDPPLDQVADYIESSYIQSMASKVMYLFSIDLYKAKGSRPALASKWIDFLRQKTNFLQYSRKYLSVKGYRPSLHGNLHRNFDRKWPKGKLMSFRRSNLLPIKDYGESYYYDLEMLDIVLSYEPLWAGYRKEIVEANVNLSYVDSQILLVKAMCFFLTSLTVHASRTNDDDMLQLLQTVAMSIIDVSLSEDMGIPLFLDTFKRRLETCFFILYHLSKANKTVADVGDLQKTYRLLADVNIDFLGVASSADSASDHKLYKQMLKIINLCLDDFSKKDRDADFALVQQIGAVLELVVIRGMKAVTQSARAHPQGGAIEDIVQITMILRKCLKIKGVSTVCGNLVIAMVDTACDRAVMSLYSYALELMVGGDAIYGELSLLYLLEWLSVDVMAERFVTDGLLGVIIESPVSKLIQQSGVTPWVDTRLHGIWTKGILVIVLELLRQLGSRIVPEVLVFLNFFSEQIRFALGRWVEAVQSPGTAPFSVCLATINETSQLLLLLDIVTKLCEADQVKRIPNVMPNQGELIEAFDYLLTHQKYLASGVSITTAEEQKLDEDNKLLSTIVKEVSELRDFLRHEDDS